MITPEVKERHSSMLYPTVRVVAKAGKDKATGSGTVLYSKPNAEGEIESYILTCHHVVENLISVKKKWDPAIGKEVKREKRDTATVELFNYNNYSDCIGTVGKESDIVVYSADKDLALLKLRDKENQIEYVAEMYPKDKISDIHLYDHLWGCGAAMGHPPVATEGHVAFMNDEIEGEKYWMSTAASIFGDSGGSIYRLDPERGYEFVGVPARITVAPMGFSADPIVFLGYFVPITSVYGVLDHHFYQFIYDDEITPEESAKKREARKEKERERLKLTEGTIE